MISGSALVDVEAVFAVGAEREADTAGAAVGAAQVHTHLVTSTVIVHTLVIVCNKSKDVQLEANTMNFKLSFLQNLC